MEVCGGFGRGGADEFLGCPLCVLYFLRALVCVEMAVSVCAHQIYIRVGVGVIDIVLETALLHPALCNLLPEALLEALRETDLPKHLFIALQHKSILLEHLLVAVPLHNEQRGG